MIRLTASFGVAQFIADDKGVERTLERADKALYEAKKAGRNRVQAADSEKSSE